MVLDINELEPLYPPPSYHPISHSEFTELKRKVDLIQTKIDKIINFIEDYDKVVHIKLSDLHSQVVFNSGVSENIKEEIYNMFVVTSNVILDGGNIKGSSGNILRPSSDQIRRFCFFNRNDIPLEVCIITIRKRDYDKMNALIS